MMKLKDYLIKKRISKERFAVECEIGIATVYRHLSGKNCGYRIAKKIEEFTNGEVTVEDLIYTEKEN